MVQKHVAFAPAGQKQLGSRIRSPLLRRGTMPAQPFSRFFHHIAFAKRFYWDGPLFFPLLSSRKSSLSPFFLIELSSKKRDKKNELRNASCGSP